MARLLHKQACLTESRCWSAVFAFVVAAAGTIVTVPCCIDIGTTLAAFPPPIHAGWPSILTDLKIIWGLILGSCVTATTEFCTIVAFTVTAVGTWFSPSIIVDFAVTIVASPPVVQWWWSGNRNWHYQKSVMLSESEDESTFGISMSLPLCEIGWRGLVCLRTCLSEQDIKHGRRLRVAVWTLG